MYSSSKDGSRAEELLRSAMRLAAPGPGSPATAAEWAHHVGQDEAAVGRALDVLSAGPPTTTPTAELFPDHVLVDESQIPIDLVDTEVALATATDHVRWRLGSEDRTVLVVGQRALSRGAPLWSRMSYHLLDPDSGYEPAQQLARATEIASVSRSLAESFELFFRAGLGRTASTFEAVRADESAAQALDVEVSTVLLFRETTVCDDTGRPRMLSYTHFRADRVGMHDVDAGPRAAAGT